MPVSDLSLDDPVSWVGLGRDGYLPALSGLLRLASRWGARRWEGAAAASVIRRSQRCDGGALGAFGGVPGAGHSGYGVLPFPRCDERLDARGGLDHACAAGQDG